MAIGKTNIGLGGGGEKHYATITCTTDDYMGKTVTCVCSDVSYSASATYSSEGQCAFTVNDWGTYTLTCEGKTKTISVTAWYVTYSVEFSAVSLVSFSTGTDDEITAMVEAYYDGTFSLSDIQSVWKVGNSRSISVSAMSATGVGESHHADAYEFTIIDFNHDTLTTSINGKTKALVTLQMKRVMTTAGATQSSGNSELGYMNSSNTNNGGWTSSARRTWCNSVFFNALPSYIQALCKPVNKLTSAGNQSTTINTDSDKVFLPSEIEIFGSTTYSASGEGSQYSYFTTASNRYKLPAWTSSYASARWWERSPNSSDSTAFCDVNVDGSAYDHTASTAYGLAPAFCI